MQPKSSMTQVKTKSVNLQFFEGRKLQSDTASPRGLIERQVVSQQDTFEVRGGLSQINVD